MVIRKVILVLLLTCWINCSLAFFQSAGPGGVQCGPNVCLANVAECVGGRCRCKVPLSQGDGILRCQEPGTGGTAARIENDPVMKTFGGEKVEVDSPCRLLLTHAVSDLVDTTTAVTAAPPPALITGVCDIKIYTFTARIKGKFYDSGTDIYVNKIASSGDSNDEFSVRFFGKASGGAYIFRVWNKEDVYDLTKWLKVNGPGELHPGLTLDFDAANNRMLLTSVDCGFTVAFRPADRLLANAQRLVPGVSLSYNSNHNPRWQSLKEELLLPPKDAAFVPIDRNVSEVEQRLGLNATDAFLYRALTGHGHQNFPKSPLLCGRAVYIMRMCKDVTKRQEAMGACSWMLNKPPFVDCISQGFGTDNALGLFVDCVSAVCGGDRRLCEKVKEDANQSCSDHVDAALTAVDCAALA